jgi:protein MpaA
MHVAPSKLFLLILLLSIGCADDDRINAPTDSRLPAIDMSPADDDMGVTSDRDLGMMMDVDGDVSPSPWGGAWRIGSSVEGRPIVAEEYGVGGPVLFLLSAIHGNERSAVTWGERARTILLGGLARRHGIRIAFIGAANPDGIAASTRGNARGIDLNRNFATQNFGEGTGEGGERPLSEPESEVIQSAFDTVAPSAVISVHCCAPTFDYDGPGLSLASAMADVMPESLRYPTERLGSRPGSFGSYVGVDNDTPIITLEFAAHDYLDFFEQLDALEFSVEAAAQWTAENPGLAASDSLAGLAQDDSGFRTELMDISAADLPIRVEHTMPNDGPPVVLLSGFGPTSQDSLLVAEHLRRVLLSNVAETPLRLLTALNVDGLTLLSESNADGIDVVSDFDGPRESREARALARVLETAAARLVIWVRSAPRDVVSTTGMDLGLSVPPGFHDAGRAEGAAVDSIMEQAQSLLIIGIGSTRGQGDLASEDLFPETDIRPISAMVRRLVTQNESCAIDGYCDVLCEADGDCECPCDYNSACEAAMRNSTATCACDGNCFDGRVACQADQHCDTWCPEGADPDCSE